MKRTAGEEEASALQVRTSTCAITGAHEGVSAPLCTHVNIPTSAQVHLWHALTLPEQAAVPLTPAITTTRTDGELVEGNGRAVVSQGIADTDGDLVLDGGEQVHVADVAAVLEGWVLLTDHNFGAVPGREGGPGTVTDIGGQVGAGWGGGGGQAQGRAGVLDSGRGEERGRSKVGAGTGSSAQLLTARSH